MLTAPLAHDEQHVGTLIGGCLEILFLPYTWLSNIRFLSVNLLRILLLLKYSLCSSYIILEISSFSAHSQPGKSQSMPVFLIIKTIYRLYIYVYFQYYLCSFSPRQNVVYACVHQHQDHYQTNPTGNG